MSFFLKMCFFHCFISVFILFVFLLLRFYDCGSSYAPASGNKTLHGPMLLESRLFCSHVLRSLCFFLNNKLRCASLEICKNNVRLNALIYAQLLQLPTNFTIQLCFFCTQDWISVVSSYAKGMFWEDQFDHAKFRVQHCNSS